MDDIFRREQALYGELYLFVARELGASEGSLVDFTARYPDGLWRTTAFTGLTGGIGMHLNRPPLHPEPHSRAGPLNTAWFAGTGGDGIFYSFLLAHGRWSDGSPVVVTFPGGGSRAPSWIAGANLGDFLRLGARVRYDLLPDLIAGAVGGDAASIAWLESGEFAEWVEPAEVAQLGRLVERFGLDPLDEVAIRVAQWQRAYLMLVRHSTSGG